MTKYFGKKMQKKCIFLCFYPKFGLFAPNFQNKNCANVMSAQFSYS